MALWHIPPERHIDRLIASWRTTAVDLAQPGGGGEAAGGFQLLSEVDFFAGDDKQQRGPGGQRGRMGGGFARGRFTRREAQHLVRATGEEDARDIGDEVRGTLVRGGNGQSGARLADI